MCLATMLAAGTSLKAQEVTITLNPGWTWISNPTTDTLDFATALGSFTPAVGDIIRSQWGSASYMGGQWRGTISQFYPGYGYKYKSTRTVPVQLTMGTPLPQVSVTTAEPGDITATSAVVGSTVAVEEGSHVFLRGVCWGTEPEPTIDGSHTSGEAVAGSQNVTLSELTPSTTYYVRAYMVSDNGLAYGNELSFTTLSGIPSVTTVEVTDILGDGATCGGTVTDSGGLDITARGVCWSTSHNPTLGDSHTTDGTGTGDFVSTLTGLSTSTTYYVRAYATTAQATSYGEEMTFTTMNGIPSVSTAEVTDITATTATCGGTVTDDGGLAITARGVCWSTSHNPTLSDSHTTDGTGTGSFTSSLTSLSASTTYYVRAYASNSLVTIYGGERSFTTEASGSGGDHAYVDLGLPSGTLWATCNVGADTPEGYGDYFAWGEIMTKNDYSWSTYQYCNGSYNTLTKYCNNSSYGYNGFTDNLTTLLPEDDAATANWGSGWRMPTQAEWQELLDNTTVTWTTQNGVNGRLFTSTMNGYNLFLPATGAHWGDSPFIEGVGAEGNYWSSSIDTNDPRYAYRLYFDSDNYFMDNGYTRNDGFTVRPVRVGSQNNAPTGAINGIFSVSDSTQVYFSQGNLQYQASTDTWKFAENQYDYVGSTNSNISSTYSGWIDLFGWGTSGYHNTNDPYNVKYQPWSTSTSQVNSSYNYYGYGPSTNMTDPNLTGTSANYDWGVYNPISNGGNTANQWRTLTQPEWNYVFNTRITTSGIRYAKANVNNVNGVILLPDDWSSSTYSLSNTNSSGASFSSNTITAAQWTALEDAGAVFLPAAGYRSGTSVFTVGSLGGYWSASCNYSNYAYYVYFDDSSLYTSIYDNRYYGFSVRLARVAEN